MLGAFKFDTVMKRVFGSSNDRRLKGYRPKVAAINALEPEFEALTDDQLRAKTEQFRAELKAAPGNLTRRVKKLLVRQPVLLDDHSSAKLKEVLASNQMLKTVHDFRERLQVLWSGAHMSNDTLLQHLRDWIAQAEASGIKALQAFFESLPADTGAAFIVIIHLDPRARSELAAILSSCTSMLGVPLPQSASIHASNACLTSGATSSKLKPLCAEPICCTPTVTQLLRQPRVLPVTTQSLASS